MLRESIKDKKVFDEYFIRFFALVSSLPHPHITNTGTENSTGNHLHNSHDCHECFEAIHLENCRYCVVAYDMQDSMDTSVHNPNCSLDYEAIGGGKLVNCQWNVTGWECDHIEYCDNCFSSSYLFGCVGLRNKQYCILNKQYTREEYATLVPKIIAHMRETSEWGEFFDPSLSPFGYNETVAHEYFPLTRTEALAKGFNWSDYEAPFPQVTKTIP